jgi:hypothetical protein
MTLAVPLDVQIRTQVAAVLAGEIGLDAFYDWFIPATWEVERTGNSEAVRLTHDLVHLFSELTSGLLTRDEVKQALEAAASSSTQPDRQRIA